MPPEQSYGARGLSKSDHDAKVQISRKLKLAGLKLSPRGLDQVMGAQLVSNMTDREELAKLVRKVGDYDLGSWSKTTGL
ncbi:hypothetical protein [Litoreibacter janthinus]|uniref:Uncharacterized protein n=1 Tax=Litoreibacter janthinus TaxID=670154 RepID=A0A1I6FRM8_9RHOB|nr:hypothetical protein [Litoreibacter janthinus]SFR32612.1 hypothetical protein SAMN04488002_0167 [Litoreibacter janthinus]